MASLERFLSVAFLVPQGEPTKPECIWGLPVNIEGLSGIGKSERIQAAGAAVGLDVQTVYPATKQPEDFTGAPFATKDGVVIECILPQARKLLSRGMGVLFIDEISCARPAVQAALLSVVNERRIGDHILPPKVRIVTAMNPPEYAAGGFGLEPPLANRLAHVNYKPPTNKEWIDWLLGNSNLDVTAIQNGEQRVIAGWSEHWPEARGLLAGFMETRGSHLHDQPKPDDANAGGAWPSPRTWNWAGRAKATACCLGADEGLQRALVEACVGKGVMTEWMTWLREANLPKPIDMLNNGWTPQPRRLDITRAALTSMATYLGDLKDRQKKLQLGVMAWNILGQCVEMKISDMAVKSGAVLCRNNIFFDAPDCPPDLHKISEDVIYAMGQKGLTPYANKI